MTDLGKLRIHHIGYAVKDIDIAIALFQKMGYICHGCVADNSRNVSIAFMNNGVHLIELISPLNTDTVSPVDTILKKNGPMPYHICYETDSIPKTIADLKSEHFHQISEVKPASAINGKDVVFLYNSAMGLIELVEI